MRRVVSLGRVRDDVVGVIERVGEGTRERPEERDLAVEHGRIELAIAEAPEDLARHGARALDDACRRRQPRRPAAPGAVGQHEDARARLLEPSVHAQLVAGVRDHQHRTPPGERDGGATSNG